MSAAIDRSDTDHLEDPRFRDAVDELSDRILAVYPDARLRIGPGRDPGTVFIYATVDLDDPEPVLDLVIDRMMDLLVDEGLPVYVIPLTTPERDEAQRRARANRFPPAIVL